MCIILVLLVCRVRDFMKLYQYDHCPFCVRADMVANYKKVDHDKVYLLNDDEKSCHDLIGAKMVPILQFDDGTAMGESLDIAKFFDEQGTLEQVIRPAGYHQSIAPFFEKVRLASWCLLFPRNIAIGLPEFETQEAKDYFRQNKEAMIERSFEQALDETEQHKLEMEAVLAEIPELILPSQHDNTISWDDVFIYPNLRNLTMVKGLIFPQQILRYIQEVTEITGSHTYFDRAI